MTNVSRYLVVLLITLWASEVLSGELDRDLAETILHRQPDELVAVWVALPPVHDVATFKASLSAQANTRTARYRLAVNRLRRDHGDAQQAVVQKLRQLQAASLATSIKPHWIANIVEVEIAVSELTALASRPDVMTIFAVPKITAIKPTRVDWAPTLAAGVEDNLKFINADDAWAAGYTGTGRVICSFDSGVDGLHPALFNTWKGHDGDSAAAWFDPRDRESFPHTISGVSTSHGTQTIGIIIGHDDVTGDTVGVAPGARWIATAVIDIPGTSIIDAFEWAADPDGDPNSIDDLPDVISHSWGVPGIGCANIFYDMIDNVEALGIINIFAAGNDGLPCDTCPGNVRNPANRANDSLDCFAVGNVNSTTVPPVIIGSSSRGPSDCNGSIKPNVTAPGDGIRTSTPGGGYALLGGTSAATPHVSGLVALLRQKNPNATVDEIKEAIVAGARDFGYSLPNNDYGWGIIDCMAALNALSSVNSSANVRLFAFDHPPIAPGDTVAGTVVLHNTGAPVTEVSAALTGSDPSLRVLSGSAWFGTIIEGDIVRSTDSIRVIVADTVTEGSILSLDMLISGNEYSQTVKLYFVVEPVNQRLFVTHNAGRVSFTVSNFGAYGMGPNSFFPAGGLGFTFDGGTDDIYECGLMIATDADHVSDGLRNAAGEPDGDFAVLPGGNIQLQQPGAVATEESFAQFDDSRAGNPLGIEVAQQTYAFDYPPYDQLIIIRYILTNTNPYDLQGVYVGLYVDWDINSYGANAGGWDNRDEFTWTAYNTAFELVDYRGVKVVHGQPTTAVTARADILAYYPEGLTEQEKFSSLTEGFLSDSTYMNTATDLLQLVAVGPLTLGPGRPDTVAFAILAGDTFDDIALTALTAQCAYTREVMGISGVQEAIDSIYPSPGSSQDLLVTNRSISIQFNQAIAAGSLADHLFVNSAKGDIWSPPVYDSLTFVVTLNHTTDYLLSLDTIELILDPQIVPGSNCPLDHSFIDTFFVGAAVYPGDANNDGVVDERDILPIGLHWNKIGPVRADSGDISWMMKPAHAFVPGRRWTPATAVFADADGSGLVDTFDICAVAGNWLLTHNGARHAAGDNWSVVLKQLDGDHRLQLRAALETCPDSRGKQALIGILQTAPEDESAGLPKTYQLYQNYPNPFNPSTVIQFYLPRESHVTLDIYNILGQKVAMLLDDHVGRGFRQVVWSGVDQSGRAVASGVYFYRLETDEVTSTRRMTLLK